GDVAQMPAATLAQAPRSQPFPMPPNPPMYGGTLLAAGARRLGFTAYPFPMAVNSTAYDGRPRCNSCGFCSGYGCPRNARGGAAGRNLMFHVVTIAGGVFNEDVHAWRGPSTTFTIDDFVGPVQGAAAAAAGLPYLKGGICEVGGTLLLLGEAQTFAAIPNSW